MGQVLRRCTPTPTSRSHGQPNSSSSPKKPGQPTTMSAPPSNRPIHTVAITGASGSVGHRTVLFFLKQGCDVLAMDITPLPDSLVRLLADELDIRVGTDEGARRFRFVQVDLRDWDETLACLKNGLRRSTSSKSRGDVNARNIGGRHGWSSADDCVTVSDGKVDGVVHLGAIKEPSDYVVKTHNTNVVTSYNVLRAAAELGINRVVQASSINVFPLIFSEEHNIQLDYFPIDENHHNRVDEPYGLSKVIAELQADSLCLRYPSLRVASLRLHWSVPSIAFTAADPLASEARSARDLWGWLHEDEGARAFWLALMVNDPPSSHCNGAMNGTASHDSDSNASSDDLGSSLKHPSALGWKGHEAFNITAPTTRCLDTPTEVLRKKYYKNVPIREKDGIKVTGRDGFFDCSKARRLLGWVHQAADA